MLGNLYGVLFNYVYQFPVIHESDEDIMTKIMETVGQILVAAPSL
jgi:hypothetical protein